MTIHHQAIESRNLALGDEFAMHDIHIYFTKDLIKLLVTLLPNICPFFPQNIFSFSFHFQIAIDFNLEISLFGEVEYDFTKTSKL